MSFSFEVFLFPAQRSSFNKKLIPTKLAVVERVLYETSIQKQNPAVAIHLVANEVVSIWSGRRKTAQLMLERNIIRSIHAMYEKYCTLKKSSHRNTTAEQEKRKRFIEEFEVEFNIESKPKVQMPEEDDNESEEEEFDETESGSSEYSSADESEYVPETSTSKAVRTKKIRINPAVVSALDNAGLSNRNATSIVLTIAKFLGIDPSELVASSSSMERNRAKIRNEICAEIKRKFGENVDEKFIVLHWDGKILPKWSSVDGKSDRLAVVVTYGSESKILGAAELADGTAQVEFNAIRDILTEWILERSIKAICCDTTSTNTGERKGVCQRLRQMYNGNILTLSCRHHIMELLVSKAYSVALNDVSKSPNIQLFERFKSQWNSFDVTKFDSCYNIPKVKIAISTNERKAIIKFAREQLSFQKHSRKDYIEFLHLTLLFLGEKDINTIRVPGALHRARFMARVIYSLKMTIFRKQFDMSGEFFCVSHIFSWSIYVY